MKIKTENNSINEYLQMSDEQLVKLAQEEDKIALEILIKKYTGIIKRKAARYYIQGAENEDLVQEGLIGLYEAIKAYNPDKYTSFKYFANICITRQIITAFDSANRQKNSPLKDYVSLNKEVCGQYTDLKYEDMISSVNSLDPLEICILEEEITNIENKVNALLSDFEKKIFSMYLNGCTYNEMADKLNCKVKRVDNALQRIRKKIETYLSPIKQYWQNVNYVVE